MPIWVAIRKIVSGVGELGLSLNRLTVRILNGQTIEKKANASS